MASQTVPLPSAAPACLMEGVSSLFQRGKSSRWERKGKGNMSLPSSESVDCSSVFNQQPRPTVKSCSGTCPQLGIELAFNCHAAQTSSSGSLYDHSSRYSFSSSRFSLWRGFGCDNDGTTSNWRNRRNRRKGWICKVSGRSEVGSLEWLSKATPYEVLGISADSTEEEIKLAFRARIKEYHPDVYQGLGDADAITQRLLRAYELLTGNLERTDLRTRKSFDPFEEPECVAEDVFVNEFACIGRGCPYSCVERAPNVFQFAPETGCARAFSQDSTAREGGYDVQLAVGQCPRNCIHYVTPEQRFRLEEILQSVLEGRGAFADELGIMDGLIARAKFENGRYNPPKRKAKKSEQWVDWY